MTPSAGTAVGVSGCSFVRLHAGARKLIKGWASLPRRSGGTFSIRFLVAKAPWITTDRRLRSGGRRTVDFRERCAQLQVRLEVHCQNSPPPNRKTNRSGSNPQAFDHLNYADINFHGLAGRELVCGALPGLASGMDSDDSKVGSFASSDGTSASPFFGERVLAA